MAEGGYAKTYRELLETTDWSRYGQKSGNPKCANCMVHVGYEPTAVLDAFSNSKKFGEMVIDFLKISRPLQPEPVVG